MQLELSLYAQGLKNVAGAFKGTSDPFAVVTQLATTPGAKPRVLGKTEVIHNTLSPQWTTVFKLEYELGTPVKVAVSIFDEETKRSNKPMGSAVFDIGELLGGRGNTKAKRLKHGTLVAHVRKSAGSGVLRFKLKGSKLKNVEGLLSKSDPFFELSRQINAAGGSTWDNVYRSKPIHNNLNPEWEEATLELSTLCGGNLDLPLLVTVADFESSGKHTPMGQFETTVHGLVAAASSGSDFTLTRKGKECGKVSVVKAQVAGAEPDRTSTATTAGVTSQLANLAVAGASAFGVSQPGKPDFVDYVAGGCQLNVVVAIDFTGSNGDPRKPGTLHYMDRNSKNDYEKAISAILTILQKYDNDQLFPVLGFGAKYDGVVKHCFQVGPSEYSKGVDGVLNSYNHVFESGLTLSAPTDITEVIKRSAGRAQRSLEEARKNGGLAYTILLIVTDGAVSDVDATAACLRQVSSYPLSIVIVGVGNADFSAMQFLDDSAKGCRDIAQFIEFNKHSHSSVDLTSATLKEIPNQLVECFQSKRYPPNPPVVVKEADIVVEDEAEEEIDLSLNIGAEDEIVVAGGGNVYRDGF